MSEVIVGSLNMNADMRHAVVFLLGAGASAEAGVCTSKKITEILLNYGSYCPSESSTAIENLLKYIQVRIADYLQVRTSDVNFEYLLGTLMELSRREEYPIVPFLGEGDLLVRKLEEKISLTEVIDKLYALLRELLRIRHPVDYLYPLGTFLNCSKPLDLFTLNYDLSLETAFKNLNIPYTTGYRKRKQGLPLWDPSEFESGSFDVRVFKLHGSVNWGQLSMYPPPPMRSEPTFEAFRAAEYYVANYPERVEFDPFPIVPVAPPDRTMGTISIMNFGTRKELLYASSQFTVLFHCFLNALHQARACVVAGYSFRDERINRTIEEAIIVRKGGLHLIIVDPSAFRIERHNPILERLRELKWVTEVGKPFGEALRDGSLLAAVEASFETKVDSASIVEEISILEQERALQQEPDPERILEAWRILGTTFDLTHFWMRLLEPELRDLEHCTSKSEAIKVGHDLMPLIRKVRDLCHHIRWVYEQMQFDGTYGGEYIETIEVEPKLTHDFSRMDLVRKWLPRLGRIVSAVFNTYNGATDEFRHAVTDPDYGRDIGASNLSVAELVARKTTSRIYELVLILNDIYKGAGYEEPFEMIARHRAGDLAD